MKEVTVGYWDMGAALLERHPKEGFVKRFSI